MRVRVLVVNYNSGPWLQRCLDSLAAQTMRDFEVVLVDNASDDDSLPDTLPDARFRLHRAEQNLGFAAANNLAARGTRAPWLAMLNPDAIAEPDWLAQLMSEAEAHPGIDIFGSTQLRADEPGVLDGTGDCLSAWGPNWRSGYGLAVPERLPAGEVFSACGAAMLVRRPCFEALGGFEESYFCYVEDVDLCFRARLQGARVWQSRRARVRHAGGGSTEAGESLFSMRHGYRNSIWMLLRCTPMPLLLLALPGLVAFMFLRMAVLRRAGQRGALWQGLREGFSELGLRLGQRRAIQATRTVDVFEAARWHAWNPLDILRRRCVLIRKG